MCMCLSVSGRLRVGVCVCVCAEATRSLEKTSNYFTSLDLRSSVPPYHHTPWGLELAVGLDQSTLTASSGYGGRSTWRASTACFTAMAPSCHSPQGFQAWAWPAHPTIVSWPNALVRARCTQEEEVCVCVCMCMCTCMDGYIPVSGNSSNVILVTSIAAPN